MTNAKTSQLGNTTAIIIISVAALAVIGAVLYYFLVFSPAQLAGQNNRRTVEGATNQSLTVDDLDQKVKGVNTSDPIPADELNPVSDTLGL